MKKNTIRKIEKYLEKLGFKLGSIGINGETYNLGNINVRIEKNISSEDDEDKIILDCDESEDEGLKEIREHKDCTDFIDENKESCADLKRKNEDNETRFED
jgi:hypothetical protein